MIRRTLLLLASLETTIGLLFYLTILVIAGTLLQSAKGLDFAQETVFHSWFLPWPIPLPGMILTGVFLAVNLLLALFIRLSLRSRHTGVIMIHTGLLLMLGGGFIARYSVQESFITLAAGETTDRSGLDSKSSRPSQLLPFSVKLLRFQVHHYPGSQMAREYESLVEITSAKGKTQALIRMNRPLRVQGYTLYQNSYGHNQTGKTVSTLSLVKNPGRVFFYLASFLLVLGIVVHFLIVFGKKRSPAEAA